ncbi:hypothetical protein LMG7974_01593 [Campylobacter majalis]|uniref:Uncharacterized protein n=1 Tax=Campylobacter majalis TaxID=2790656 RepID=A0ABN7KAP3_9BACT|nr:hypothetical protein [Campylobacter majalis]CAD7289516.1 hypothetical protein LMG7974_01593 [Campylobacter majalis]
MLQKARSANSKSFLRELEFALIIISDDNVRSYFLQKLAEVFAKRKKPDQLFTGEKAIKKEILAYLNQKGEIRTANVWCRNIDINIKDIQELNAVLFNKLLTAKAEGILEIHLQDREINSPHVQFVGTNAHIAEQIIAQVLVDFGYESSIESAIGRKDEFIPYYEIDESARTAKLDDMIEYVEQKEKREFEAYSEKFDKESKKTQELLQKIKERTQSLKKSIQSSDELFKQDIANRRNKLRRIRRRIFKRK